MSLFEENVNEQQFEARGGGRVESVHKNKSALQDLIKEFKELRNSSTNYHTEENEIEEYEFDDGEEYKVSEEESASIEDFLNDDEVFEEDEEVIGENEEIIDDEEIIEEELEDIDYMKYLEDDFDFEIEDEDKEEPSKPIDVQVNITEVPSVADEEEIAYEPSLKSTDNMTNEEIDRKFDEFEKRLLDKINQQFAMLNASVSAKSASSQPADELEVKTVKGQLVINGYTFTGEVVMFTPLESLPQATWEEVVRRKGHCTYHLTTSGNGGWFIKKSNAPNPYAYIEKKEDAEELAKFYAMREKAELKIHNAKGVIEKSLSFGREKLRG